MAQSVRIVSCPPTGDVMAAVGPAVPEQEVRGGDVSEVELGTALLHEGRATDAIEIARAALLTRPRSPELLLLLGRAHFVLGELSEARRVLLTGTMVAPEHHELSIQLAQVMLHLGESDRAVRVLRRAVRFGRIDDRMAELYARAHLAWERKKMRGGADDATARKLSVQIENADDDDDWETRLVQAKAAAKDVT